MRVAALVATTALAGCAATVAGSGDGRCRVTDWRAVGVEDGENGYSEDRFEYRTARCDGAAPDRSAWSEGRVEGLTRFCSIEGAHRAGIERRDFSVCDNAAPGALAAYQRGLRYGEISREIIALERYARDLRDGRHGDIGFRSRDVGAFGRASGARRALIAVDDADRLEALNDVRDKIRELQAEREAFAP